MSFEEALREEFRVATDSDLLDLFEIVCRRDEWKAQIIREELMRRLASR